MWRRVLARLGQAIEYLTSEGASRKWVSLASLVTIITLPLVLWQVIDLREQRVSRAMAALMTLDQRFDLEGSRVIRHSLQYATKPTPLLQPEGPATPESLGDFLDTMESLASLLDRKLVDIDDIDEWFGDLIARTAQHPEVRAYIREQQKDNAAFYTGFESMSEQILKLNPPPRPPPTIKAAPSPR